MNAYAPRSGSVVEKAIDIIRIGPTDSKSLATTLGVTLYALADMMRAAIAHGMVERQKPDDDATSPAVCIYRLKPAANAADEKKVRVLTVAGSPITTSVAALAAANPFGSITTATEEPQETEAPEAPPPPPSARKPREPKPLFVEWAHGQRDEIVFKMGAEVCRIPADVVTDAYRSRLSELL